MKLREALLTMSPSLALQRAAADEIARLDGEVARLRELLEKPVDEMAKRHYIGGMDSTVRSSNREIEMACITTLSVYDIQERMGTEASKRDAECMLAILSREGIGETDEVSESQWLEWCAEAAQRARRESILTVSRNNRGFYVEDSEGGVWWPDEETAAKIAAAADPEAEALRICEETGGEGGTWQS